MEYTSTPDTVGQARMSSCSTTSPRADKFDLSPGTPVILSTSPPLSAGTVPQESSGSRRGSSGSETRKYKRGSQQGTNVSESLLHLQVLQQLADREANRDSQTQSSISTETAEMVVPVSDESQEDSKLVTLLRELEELGRCSVFRFMCEERRRREEGFRVVDGSQAKSPADNALDKRKGEGEEWWVRLAATRRSPGKFREQMAQCTEKREASPLASKRATGGSPPQRSTTRRKACSAPSTPTTNPPSPCGPGVFAPSSFARAADASKTKESRFSGCGGGRASRGFSAGTSRAETFEEQEVEALLVCSSMWGQRMGGWVESVHDSLKGSGGRLCCCSVRRCS